MLNNLELESRFYDKIFFDTNGSGCWVWVGARTGPLGYGQVRHAGKIVTANRFSWLLHIGAIPEGLDVLHRCDFKPCVNPRHLFLGTQRDNALDASKKGLLNSVHGEIHPSAKLNEAEVRRIRKLYASGRFTQRRLGEMFGVHRYSICSITIGKTWKRSMPTYDAIEKDGKP